MKVLAHLLFTVAVVNVSQTYGKFPQPVPMMVCLLNVYDIPMMCLTGRRCVSFVSNLQTSILIKALLDRRALLNFESWF